MSSILHTEDMYRIDILTAIPRPEERDSLCACPLTLTLNGTPVGAVTCSPEQLAEMALGYLVSGGYLENAASLTSVRPSEEEGTLLCTASLPLPPRRILSMVKPFKEYRWTPSWLHFFALEKQPLAGSLQRSFLLRRGEILYRCRDIDARCAVDKALGCALRDHVPLSDSVLFVDGLLTEELVGKAVMAGVPVFCGSGIPTDRAVTLARRHHLELVGSVRKDGINIFSDRYLWR